jgi:photosystem II stability/assembly factor-like uncharacterized protein
MINKKTCISIPGILTAGLLLAGCMGLPGTADRPDQTPTDKFAPTEAHLERTPIITEGGILQSTPTVQLKETATMTLAASISPTATPGSPISSFMPLPGLLPGQQVTISYIDMIDEDNGWAIGGEQDPGDRVLRTNDSGHTWQDITPPYLSGNENAPGKLKNAFFLDTTSAWVIVYYLPQSDPPEGFQQHFATWRTQDGGLNWTVSEPVDLFIALLGPNDSQIYDPSPPPFMQFLDTDHGWTLIRDSRPGMFKYFVWMYKTRDGGQHWIKVFDPDSGLLQMGIKTGMIFADQETGWSTTELEPVGMPFFRHTTDGGNNWEEIWLPAPEVDPDLVEHPWCGNQHSPHLFSPTSGMLVVDCLIPEGTVQPADILYATVDNGQNWRSDPYPGGTLLMLNPSVGWALSRDIYQTIDGGQTWEKLKTVNWDGQFDFVSERSGFAVARAEDRVVLVRTFNAGRTWEILEPVLAP